MQTIMFIRHAEKPQKQEKGVTPDGDHDEHSLSVRGWTRAGALAALFTAAPANQHLAQPRRVIATAPSHSYKSKREHDTARPTAERLGLPIEGMEIPDQYVDVVRTINDSKDPTLVVWHHGSIPDFVRAFPITNIEQIPTAWPEDRFDLIWVLSPRGDAYEWSSVNQGLLDGDTIERASN